jgi:hypothetical protein
MLETKIWRTAVPGEPRQKSFETSISMEKKLDIVVHTCHPAMEGSIK